MSSVSQAEADELQPALVISSVQVVAAGPRVPACRSGASGATPGAAEVADDLRLKVLFPEARRLRRRRWAIGSGIVAVAVLALGAVVSSTGLLSATPGPSQAARENIAVLASGAHASLYFRPVECTIAQASTSGAGTAAGAVVTLGPAGRGLCSASPAAQGRYPNTPPGKDEPGSIVVLPQYLQLPPSVLGAGRYVLGPAEMSGSVIANATPMHDPQIEGWVVAISFTKTGSAQFNAFAAKHYRCYTEDPSNPPFCALQAVAVDGTVLSAPALEAGSFPAGATIGNPVEPYTKAQAVELAALVRSSSSMAPLHS